MKLNLEFGTALCYCKEFVINGVEADEDDFGSKWDHDTDSAEPYSCGDMRFEGKLATQSILDKYKINVEEYNEIVSKLTEGLSFGSCGWCS